MRSVLAFAFCLLFVVGFSTDSFAQAVRFRSQVTPTCSTSSSSKFADIYADGNIAVQGSYNCRGAFIYDISDPDNPTLVGHYNPNNNRQFLEAIVIGNRAYFGSGNTFGTGPGGVHIVDITNPAIPLFLGVVDSTNGNGHNTIHEMMVFEQNGGTYLIENSNSTSNKILKVINVTDPANPVFVRDITPTEPRWVHAMHIRGNRMYTSGWGTSSQRAKTEIWDISNIATQTPILLGSISDPSASATAGNSMHSSWTSEDGKYLYSAREVSASNGPSPGDIRVYDVQNPAEPVLIKRISMADIDIWAVTPHNPVVMGDKLYVSWYQAGIQVFDISDPTDPVRLGEYDTHEQAYVPDENRKLSEGQDPWDIVCGRDDLRGDLPTSYGGLWAVYPFEGEDRILLGDLTKGLLIVDVSEALVPSNKISDFDGDGKTDLSVFRPSTGDWAIEYSSDGTSFQPNFGIDGDTIVTGDYDGDGKSDPAIYRPSTGTWWVLGSTEGWMSAQFGIATDIPVAGDYDGDGKTDFAVFRPSNGVWYILQSKQGLRIAQWGSDGDKPLAGDFDGDGRTDLTVWRPSNGVWYTYRSTTDEPKIDPFGMSGDQPVLIDADGDGRSDPAVFRPSTGIWYVLNSSTGTLTGVQWGIDGDLPIPADFDGDGLSDFTVFRPSNNMWYRLDSSTGDFVSMEFGVTGDIPSPSSVQPF